MKFWEAYFYISMITHQTLSYSFTLVSLLIAFFNAWLILLSLQTKKPQIPAVQLLDCRHCGPYQLINTDANLEEKYSFS